MLEKYIDKLVPIITTIVWVGGMGYIVMNLYTCFNEDEVQEVIIPKTIDEKIDSVESDIRSKEWLKIGYEFKLDSIMAIYPLELEVHNKGIELGKKANDSLLPYQSLRHHLKENDEWIYKRKKKNAIERIGYVEAKLTKSRKSLDSLIRLKEDK
tara:strand:- start:2708 stop:3169 length:462 start_codon:yes stop_codon:yes gene_type:complete